MPVWPGDVEPQLTEISSVAKDGVCCHMVRSSLHVGTHIDAPMHMIADGKPLSEIPIDRFMGRGFLIDAREKTKIDTDLLEKSLIEKGDILLIHTGFDRKFGQPEYYETFPPITENFAHQVVERGVKMVGLDCPSPDYPPFLTHKILLGKEVLIIENMTGLENLIGVKNFEVIALPVRFESDGSPARVVARIS